jgi:hypothetical protein
VRPPINIKLGYYAAFLGILRYFHGIAGSATAAVHPDAASPGKPKTISAFVRDGVIVSSISVVVRQTLGSDWRYSAYLRCD